MPPRFTTPRPEGPGYGPAIARAGGTIGRPLHAEQLHWADLLGAIDEDNPGLPMYDELRLVVPRRAGKTVFVLAAHLERMRRRPDARCFYTSQTGEDATQTLRDEWAPLIQASRLKPVIGFRYARGDAGMFVRIGGRRLSRTEIFAPTANALHGRDSNLTTVDEVWAHSLERGRDVEQGARPARWTRRGQLLYVSAGGTEDSGWLNELVDTGRAGLPRVAYLEYSADPEDPNYDPYDEDLWWETHPGLAAGLVPIELLRQDAAVMTRAEFERALLCVWPRAAGSTLLAGWEELLSPTVKPADPLVLAWDVHPDRRSAAIAMAGAGVAELVEHRPGVDWLDDRLEELVAEHDVVRVVRDPAGPAGATRLELVDVDELTPAQVAEACAWIVDAIRAPGRLKVRPHPSIATAFAGARTYTRRDGLTVWARRLAEDDLTPLYALTLAAWAAADHFAGAIY
jgi:hypothetical protein